ncbi:MAG: DUF4139 domain-containing protein, partial [Sedimentisphaerales bacterium]
DVQAGEVAGHLEECSQCREHLEKLQRKFAALDLLREEVKASDDLITSVVEQTARPVRTRIISFRKPAWLGAAAAVLLVGFILLANHLKKEPIQESEFAKKEDQSAVEEEMRPDKFGEGMRATSPVDKAAVSSKPTFEVAKYDTEVNGRLDTERRYNLALREEKAKAINGLMDFEGGRPLKDTISEQPPFAPASAIELVVLPRRDKVQLTIYNSADLTLVREQRNLTLKKGWNWLQFMWANTLIDPTSLSLEPLAQADKIDIQQLVFPARLRELGRWLIRSEVSGQVPFEITYFTSGLNWRAFYMGTLAEDEKTMQLQGYVRVGNNSGEDYEKAQTRLIVGKVHILDKIAELAKRQYPYGRPIVGGGYGGMGFGEKEGEMRVGDKPLVIDEYWSFKGAMDSESRMKPKEIKKEGLSEYFLYSIEGTETIADKWGKRLLSFEAEDIKVKSLYKYDQERWGAQAIRFVSFTNDEEHNLGETPIPNGNVKIYNQADSEGYLSYVGGTSVKYIPVDEEVELNLGPARLVKVEPTLMNYKTENYVYDRKRNIAGWDEIRTWKIEVTNTRELPIELEITRGFGTSYWILQCNDKDISYEKHDATHARFKVNLEPRSKRTFGYT